MKDCADFTSADLDRMFEEDDRRLAGEVAADMSYRERYESASHPASREEAFYAAVPLVEDHAGETNTDYIYHIARKVSFRWTRKGWKS